MVNNTPGVADLLRICQEETADSCYCRMQLSSILL